MRLSLSRPHYALHAVGPSVHLSAPCSDTVKQKTKGKRWFKLGEITDLRTNWQSHFEGEVKVSGTENGISDISCLRSKGKGKGAYSSS